MSSLHHDKDVSSGLDKKNTSVLDYNAIKIVVDSLYQFLNTALIKEELIPGR